jgi:hypothetical protein
MNRRDIFKGLIALPVVGCVQQSDVFTLREQDKKVNKRPDVVVDTDDRYFDNWLDNHNKDEMHL